MDTDRVEGYSCPINLPSEFKTLTWDYLCHQCEFRFEMPVPRGPTEEKERECPRCGSRDIERLNVFDYTACPPGG